MSVLKTYSDTDGFKTSKSYKLSGNRIVGTLNGVEAIKQSATIMLSVERFEHLIYSLDYGSELGSMVGKPREYVKGDIERRIRECLKQDDRIEDITDFTISFERENAYVKFNVVSSFGNFEIERTV